LTHLPFQLFDSLGQLVTSSSNVSLDPDPANLATVLTFNPSTNIFTFSGFQGGVLSGQPCCPEFTFNAIPNLALPREPHSAVKIVPEPGSLSLLGVALLLVALRTRR
jgi:hypothetical protein